MVFSTTNSAHGVTVRMGVAEEDFQGSFGLGHIRHGEIFTVYS
jgi:hypothetical protein